MFKSDLLLIHQKKYVMRCVTAGLFAAMSSISTADYLSVDGVKQVQIQANVDVKEPFKDTFWIGTHNSYNAREWGYMTDPNQTLNPVQQLKAGVREIVYDIKASGNKIVLCHGACGAGDKLFRRGLEELKEFIEKGNKDQVILLKIEPVDSEYAQIGRQLEGELDPYLYKPEHFLKDNPDLVMGKNENCTKLWPGLLTKQDILKRGKNIVVVNATGAARCPDSAKFRNRVFTKLQYEDSGVESKFSKPSNSENSRELNEKGKMTRLHDARTRYGIGGGTTDRELKPDNIAKYIKSGLNIPEVFNYHGNEISGRVGPSLDAKDFSWLWQDNQPKEVSNTGIKRHCAAIDKTATDDEMAERITSKGRVLIAENCESSLPFACQNESGDWLISDSEATWEEGVRACSELSAIFSSPTYAPKLHSLLNVADVSGVNKFWVNYQRVAKNKWLANDSMKHDVEKTAANGSSEGNVVFNDTDQVFLAALSQNKRRLQAIKLIGNPDSRMHQVRLSFSDGHQVKYGRSEGKGVTRELKLDDKNGEKVSQIAFCIDRNDKKEKIFYLEFRTTLGNRIKNGSEQGSCESIMLDPEQKLVGLHGQSGDRLNKLGFYLLKSSLMN